MMDGGYIYELVDTPLDMLICKICHHPSREPHLSDCCGHTFCKSCLKSYKVSLEHPLTKEASSGGCPMCRSEEFKCFRNKQTERVIKSLKVFCTNRNEGCEWQGEINDIDKHFTHCQFQMTDCPKSCGKCVQRQYLINHVENECIRRTVSCSLCCTSGEHYFIEGQHKHYCPKFPLTCPNECGATLFRENVDEHREICLLEEVDCPNNCGIISLQRQCLNKHVTSECPCLIVSCQHCGTSGECRFVEGEHKEHCPKFPLPCPNNCEVETIPREEMQTHLDKICPLAVIQCEYHVLGCEAKVIRKDLEKHKKEEMESHLSMTTQQLTKMHVTLNETVSTLNEMVAKFQMKITEIEAATQNKVDEVENKLQFQTTVLETIIGGWAFKMYLEAMNPSCKTVPLIVRMPELMDQEVWTTDPFFTHTEGYKIILSMSPVKMIFGQFVDFSLSIFLMDGPYDDKLPWPMSGMLKITLLNQVRDADHHPSILVTCAYSNPVSHGEMKQIGYAKRFISRENLYRYNEACRFLRYNAVFFQVDIVT